MSKIRQLIDEISIQEIAGENSLENSKLITTERILISNNVATLPSQAFGDVVLNVSHIFNDLTTNVYIEATCNSSIDGLQVEFDSNDNLNGLYCVVSYLGRIN